LQGTMQKTALVYYLLLVYLFVALAQNKPNGMPGRARRRIIYRRLRKVPLRNYSLNKQSQIRPPISRTPLMSIPLTNIDEDIPGVFNSLTHLDGQESNYNILPGKEGRCFANGMIMFDKAVWSPKHCITCLCSKGKVFCDETSCNPVTLSSTISPGDTAEISGDSPVPTNPSEPVLRYMQTQDPMEKKEGILKKNIHIKNKAKMKKRRIKSHKPRRKHEHMKDQREEEVETRLEEEKRRVYEEEELRIEKEIKKQEQEQEQEHEQEQEESEQEKEGSEEEEDTLYGDVFRMLPHFPIPEPSTEIPPLPTGCSVLENTNLKNLQRLYMDGNTLVSIPHGLPSSLEELKINENEIHVINEDSFQGLKKLLILELESNKLSEANVSPLAFQPLKSLSYLRLGRNQFRTIPQGLPHSIEELYLDNNHIEEISEICFNHTKSINTIVLRHNKLEESRIAPLAWINHENLESIDLSYNKLYQVPSYLPKSLVHLVLIGNQIDRIPGFVFGHMKPGLEYLYLSFNKLDEGGIDIVAVPPERICRSRLNNEEENDDIDEEEDYEDSPLEHLHLEHNFINTRNLSPYAFSCVRSYSSVILKPQNIK
ncbi:hypothetical protein Chor_011195, partial [Crotalus horridus]